MKRAIDVFISLTLITILLPLILVVAIVVRFALGAPVLFKQQRPGLYGKPFFLYKFRTMTNAVDSSGKLLSDEQRLTAFGMFLRKYSLDELPQLFNVLKGEMSLVGPRPLLMEYIPLYTDEQRLRHKVKPGITGWAQINGRNAISWEEKFNLDIWYVKNQRVSLDIKILALTIIKVLKREGIRSEDSVSMMKFTGKKEVL
ncbi:sugar transferase [Oceanobacillus sp. 143]|uniref:Sugar transferase n=1 Tax=Oceanobacillus zhaokaii TaxID=2052660 RepID=A0A345PLA0_9BACI|nr:sugar transferase [Oceanobacillus zhaokaii]AXI10780.1 sugar transferase [Oceanobacillus zhaokaii]QGS69688.1 sugar transferase [Oceanobacillus sp. 143]